MAEHPVWDLSRMSGPPLELTRTALNRCDFPWEQMGAGSIPVTAESLSRYVRDHVAVARGRQQTFHSAPGHRPHLPGHGHVDVLDEAGKKLAHGIVFRSRVLGLFWLPTASYPLGRVMVELDLASNELLFQEVFLCEGAHAVDYSPAMSPEERRLIWEAYHEGVEGHVSDWWEEAGEQRYDHWVGEAFMIGFTRAFSDLNPRIDQFAHQSTPRVTQRIREILLPSPPTFPYVGAKGRKVFHRPECRIVKWFPTRMVPLTHEEAIGRRPCSVCRPHRGDR